MKCLTPPCKNGRSYIMYLCVLGVTLVKCDMLWGVKDILCFGSFSMDIESHDFYIHRYYFPHMRWLTKTFLAAAPPLTPSCGPTSQNACPPLFYEPLVFSYLLVQVIKKNISSKRRSDDSLLLSVPPLCRCGFEIKRMFWLNI